jgi:hypothetical protein
MLSARQPCSISSLTYYLGLVLFVVFGCQHAQIGRADSWIMIEDSADAREGYRPA